MRNFRFMSLCTIIAGVLIFGTASVACAASNAAPRLLYVDNFDGPVLDAASWATLTPWRTEYANGELGFYNSSEVTVANGELLLTSEKRPTGGREYTSGIVTSLPRQKFSYGYFEIRAKLPKGAGIWPAFWLTNDQGFEIDVFEMLGHQPDREYMTLHENRKIVFQHAYTGPDFSAGYHTFGVDWQPTYVRWYVDGVLRAEYAHKMPADPLWICLNTAVGGGWPGPPKASTHFPQTYSIDYVRVYATMPESSKRSVPKKSVARSVPSKDSADAPRIVSETPKAEPSPALIATSTQTVAAADVVTATPAPVDVVTPADPPRRMLPVTFASGPSVSIENMRTASVAKGDRQPLSPGAVTYAQAFGIARN
jgi:beta-glucanase (GH16 family)